MNKLAFLIGTFLFVTNLLAQNPIFSVENTYEYSYSVKMVEGGNGYKLLTRIWLPMGMGPWPIVMTRTPYGTTREDDNKEAQEYAKRGLGYIIQYCRGKGGSEGVFKPNEYEREDGIALVNWLDQQAWCKSIGIFGSSYTALTGWIISDQLPSKVKGLYLSHYGIDRHLSAYKDGLFRQDILTGWSIFAADEIVNKPEYDPESPFYEQYRYMPQVEMDVNMLGAELPWYRDWITHTDYEDEYWNKGVWYDLKNVPPKITVPVTIVAGLFDHHEEGTLRGYEKLNENTRNKSRLILGAWDHGFKTTPTIHDPKHAFDFSVSDDQFEWLYKVVALGEVPQKEVKAYFIGEDSWVNLDSWPISSSLDHTYYFTKKTDPEDAKGFFLSSEIDPIEEKITYIYDPQNPVISNGGETLFTSIGKRGCQLQDKIGYRDDVISFQSAVLDDDLIIAGIITVKLNVSTDADDTSFGYTVSEVFPDGSAYNIRNGITTLAYRNNTLGNRQTYEPNKIVELTINTLPITWNVKAGNRIRVDIKSSNFPEYSIHSNYAGIWALQTNTRIAHQVIYMGGNYKSSITFPSMDLNDFFEK